MALTQEQIDKNTAIFASQGRNPDGSPKTPFIGSIQTTNAGGQPGLLQYGETQMNPSGIGTRQELFTPGARGGVETKDTISTPTTTLNIPSSPSVISSDTAQRGIIDPLQAQIDAAKARARESEAGIQQLDMASMERARQQAQIRRQEEEKQQKEELLTQKAGQFRFGQAGTQYADIATQKLKETQANQLRAMDLQFQDLVDQSQKYLLQGDLRKASQLMEDAQQIQNKQFQMRQEARQAETEAFDRQYKGMQMQKMQQELVQNNLDAYSGGFVDFDAQGNVTTASPEDLQAFSAQSGIPYEQIVSSVRKKAYELSKLSDEDRKRVLEIDKLKQDLIPETFREFNYARQNLGFTGSWQDFGKVKEAYKKTSTTENVDFNQFSEEQIAMSVIPPALKNSDFELKRMLDGVRMGLKEGKTAYEIADNLMGYKIDQPNDFSNSMRKYISIGNLSGVQISDMARLINSGNYTGAVTKVEDSVMQNAKKTDPDSFIGESTAKTATTRANEVAKYIAGLKQSPIGVVTGTMQDWLGRLKGNEAQNIATQVKYAVAEMRNRLSGTAVTEGEAKFLADIIPQLGDSPANFVTKLQALKTQPLLQLNTIRSTYELPQLTEKTLMDKTARVDLYKNLNPQVNTKTVFNNWYKGLDGKTQLEVKSYLNNPDFGNSENEAMQKILQLKGVDFSKPLSRGLNGSEVQKIAQAIGQFESGGNYRAVGKDTGKGDRAMGKYQVMASNVPSWTKEALGYSMTPQQFLNNPEVQDKVAQYKMGQYYNKYGTLENVATAWFAGPGAVGKNSQAKDVVGTSVPQYIKNIRSIYNNLG